MIKRKLIGCDAVVGSIYDAVADRIIGFKNSECGYNFEKLNKDGIQHGFVYSKSEKIKILKLQNELHLNIVSGGVNETPFVKFINEDIDEDRLNIPKSMNYLLVYEYQDQEKIIKRDRKTIYKLREQVLTTKDSCEQATHVVTGIKCGFVLIAVFKYNNIYQYTKEALENILYDSANKLFNNISSNVTIKNVLEDATIDCFYNVGKTNISRDIRLGNLMEIIRNGKYRAKNPIELSLEAVNSFFCSNIFNLKFNALNDDQVETLLQAYYDFNENFKLFKNIYDIFNHYSQYFSRNIINSFAYDHTEASNLRRSFYQSLSQAKKKLYFGKISQDSKFFQDVDYLKSLLKKYRWIDEILKEIQFYIKNNVIVLDNSFRELPKNFIIFCYNLKYKDEFKNVWKTYFQEFMYYVKETEYTYVVYLKDLCPVNIPNVMPISLMQCENGILKYLSGPSSLNEQIAINSNENQTDTLSDKYCNADTNEINILLLGETGVGKSTFINAFLNYVKFKSLEDAETQPDVSNLIGSQFCFTDENMVNHKVSIGSDDNESFLSGESSTQTAKGYEFSFDNQLIRVIDTPGMGDSRGVEIDKENFEQTIKYIAQFKHVNAICFLVKPNNARLHPGFRYCFKELLTHLHKNTVENICFIFTNSRSTLFKPGDTMPALKSFLNEIQETSKVSIPLLKSNVFCLDNEAFRYLVIRKNGYEIQNKLEKENFSKSWEKSNEISKKLLEYIKKLNKLNMQEILMVNSNHTIFNEWTQMAFENFKKIMSSKRDTRKLQFYGNLKKIEKLKELEKRTIDLSAKISNFCCRNSIAVYNDDLEALLDQMVRNENKMSYFDKNYNSVANIWKNILNNYKVAKKASAKDTLEDDTLVICFNELIDINNRLVAC